MARPLMRFNNKPETFDLQELWVNFHKGFEKQVLIHPYVSTMVGEDIDHSFGLIVESEHAYYEMGIDMMLLANDPMGRLISRWVGHRPPPPDFDPLKERTELVEHFARALGRFLTIERNCPAIVREIKHLDRKPKMIDDKDSRIALHVKVHYW